MGAVDSLKSFGNSIIGNVEKAKLTVVSLDALKPNEIRREGADAPAGGSGRLAGLGNMTQGMLTDYARTVAIGITTEKKAMLAVLKNLADSNKAKKYEMDVLFNPSELKINAYGGTSVAHLNYRHKPGQDQRSASIERAKRHAELHLNLILDKTDPQAAFAGDKFTMNTTSMAKGFTKLALTRAGAKNNSVQFEVEALHGAVRDIMTRLAYFTWGKLQYQGIMNSVNSEYTMFNTNGEPCRANVSLTMVLYDEANFADASGLWADRYNRGLGGFKAGKGGIADAVESVGLAHGLGD